LRCADSIYGPATFDDPTVLALLDSASSLERSKPVFDVIDKILRQSVEL